MARKVAIIKTYDFYDRDGYGYGYETLVRSITDWAEISEEDFKMLKGAEATQGDFRVLEQPLYQEEFIANSVSAYIERAKKAEVSAAAAKLKKAAIAREKALKRLANNEKKERELFEQLKAKLGEK